MASGLWHFVFLKRSQVVACHAGREICPNLMEQSLTTLRRRRLMRRPAACPGKLPLLKRPT
ncbi:hypothetical protein BQ8794_170030 [Mesorhizobium prunaredense]|uniref:Transposase n=1 Tax=Mesorhizobium prunaredense TaxID=1631249 RepID=A0A1R3V3U0_9HYPH|nr:hypothetical protein BQ8794_170030 [Mesorhizobium prunaredense]